MDRDHPGMFLQVGFSFFSVIQAEFVTVNKALNSGIKHQIIGNRFGGGYLKDREGYQWVFVVSCAIGRIGS